MSFDAEAGGSQVSMSMLREPLVGGTERAPGAHRDHQHHDHPPGLHAGSLSVVDGVAMGCGDIIGSGIFASPGLVLKMVGAPGLALAVWAAGGLLSLLGLACVVELAAACPSAGGVFTYLRQGCGDAVAFSWQFVNFTVIVPGALAALAVTFAQYSLGLLDPSLAPSHSLDESPGATVKLTAVLVLAVMGVVNCFAGHVGSNAARFFTANTLLGCTFVVALGAYAVSGHDGWANAKANFGTDAGFAGATWGQVGPALITALWAYSGWADIAALAEELKDPAHALPRVGIGSLSIVTFAYVLMNVAYLLVLPAAQVASSPVMGVDFGKAAANGKWAGMLLAAFVSVSSLGAVFNCTFLSVRQFYATARDGLFPAVLARTNANGAPWVAALITCGWAAVLVLPSNFQSLVNFLSVALWVYYGLIGLVVVILRRKDPHLERPFKVPGYPLTPLLFFAVCMYGSVSTFVADPLSCTASTAFVLLAFPIHHVAYVLRPRWRAQREAREEAAR